MPQRRDGVGCALAELALDLVQPLEVHLEQDPILALGISDAFRDAELLAHAVAAGLSGAGPLEPALATYERRRNELAASGFQTTLQFARLQPPTPDMQELFAALRHDQEQTDRFFGTVAGTVAASEFFAPENIARITAGAQARTVVGAASG